MKSRRHLLSHGFSIIELTIAIAALAVMMTVVFSLLTTGTGGVRRAQAMMSARHLAEHQVALVRLAASTGEAIQDGADREVPLGLDAAKGMADAKCLLTVQDDDEGRPGLKRVTVRVTWSQEGGREMEYRLETLVAERRRQ